MIELCPCCSGNSFVDCCQPIVEGTKFAVTPLALMRSRYTAHARKNMPHIIRTMRDKPLTDEWFELCNWYKLEIVDAPAVSKNAKQGIVEFKAYYTCNGVESVLHERSKFSKVDGKWYYVAGQHI